MQYVGDEIMAMWNAPGEVTEHPLKACKAALRCVHTGQTQRFADGSPVKTRFGLHTVTVAVGHFGAADRLYYGAVGDGVNYCSRLEGLNRHYGTTVLVSEECRQAAGDAIYTRPIDRVAVKGRAGASMVYELVGLSAEVDDDTVAATERYGEALQEYQAGRFEQALAGFEGVLRVRPGDGPAGVMVARCRRYVAQPPVGEWDGVWRMQSK